jgi:hypothetical protein
MESIKKNVLFMKKHRKACEHGIYEYMCKLCNTHSCIHVEECHKKFCVYKQGIICFNYPNRKRKQMRHKCKRLYNNTQTKKIEI